MQPWILFLFICTRSFVHGVLEDQTPQPTAMAYDDFYSNRERLSNLLQKLKSSCARNVETQVQTGATNNENCKCNFDNIGASPSNLSPPINDMLIQLYNVSPSTETSLNQESLQAEVNDYPYKELLAIMNNPFDIPYKLDQVAVNPISPKIYFATPLNQETYPSAINPNFYKEFIINNPFDVVTQSNQEKIYYSRPLIEETHPAFTNDFSYPGFFANMTNPFDFSSQLNTETGENTGWDKETFKLPASQDYSPYSIETNNAEFYKLPEDYQSHPDVQSVYAMPPQNYPNLFIEQSPYMDRFLVNYNSEPNNQQSKINFPDIYQKLNELDFHNLYFERPQNHISTLFTQKPYYPFTEFTQTYDNFLPQNPIFSNVVQEYPITPTEPNPQIPYFQPGENFPSTYSYSNFPFIEPAEGSKNVHSFLNPITPFYGTQRDDLSTTNMKSNLRMNTNVKPEIKMKEKDRTSTYAQAQNFNFGTASNGIASIAKGAKERLSNQEGIIRNEMRASLIDSEARKTPSFGVNMGENQNNGIGTKKNFNFASFLTILSDPNLNGGINPEISLCLENILNDIGDPNSYSNTDSDSSISGPILEVIPYPEGDSSASDSFIAEGDLTDNFYNNVGVYYPLSDFYPGSGFHDGSGSYPGEGFKLFPGFSPGGQINAGASINAGGSITAGGNISAGGGVTVGGGIRVAGNFNREDSLKHQSYSNVPFAPTYKHTDRTRYDLLKNLKTDYRSNFSKKGSINSRKNMAKLGNHSKSISANLNVKLYR